MGTGAPQPMEVEAPPAPAPTEAPPLRVPPSALPSLCPSQLVAELQRVIAAAPPLDEAAVEQLLDRLVGLDLTAQEMQGSGAPPHTPHMPGVPAHLRRPPPPALCPNAMAPAARPPTSPSRGPVQARASWSTTFGGREVSGAARLRRSERALTSCTRSGWTGVPTEPQLYTVCVV